MNRALDMGFLIQIDDFWCSFISTCCCTWTGSSMKYNLFLQWLEQQRDSNPGTRCIQRTQNADITVSTEIENDKAAR